MVRERGYNGLPGIPTLLAPRRGAAGLVWVLVINIQARNAVRHHAGLRWRWHSSCSCWPGCSW